MIGVTTDRGRLVSVISLVVLFITLTLKNIPVHKGVIAYGAAGITMIIASIYFQFIKKELSLFWGIPTWIFGIFLMGFSVFYYFVG